MYEPIDKRVPLEYQKDIFGYINLNNHKPAIFLIIFKIQNIYLKMQKI